MKYGHASLQKGMLKMGVAIPVRDASWETEDHAYEDLYARASTCDTEPCLCPEGRSVNTLDSPFEIMFCDVCGSKSTHLHCSALSSPLDDWACADCGDILKVFRLTMKGWHYLVRDTPRPSLGTFRVRLRKVSLVVMGS
jgi:hypothetical protein